MSISNIDYHKKYILNDQERVKQVEKREFSLIGELENSELYEFFINNLTGV